MADFACIMKLRLPTRCHFLDPRESRERIVAAGRDDGRKGQRLARDRAPAARFEFGLSYQSKQPVAKMIGDRFPATMELAFCSALFALLVGIPMSNDTESLNAGIAASVALYEVSKRRA